MTKPVVAPVHVSSLGINPISMLFHALWGTANSMTSIVGLSVLDVAYIVGGLFLVVVVFQIYSAFTGRTSFSLEEGARRVRQ